MACADRLDTLIQLADGELPPDARRETDRHVAGCEDCRSTLHLLTLENQSIAAALAPKPLASGRPLLGRLTAVAAVVLLTCGALYGLHLVYEQVDAARDRALARSAARAEARLEVLVTIHADDLPLEAFLEKLSETSGVDVVLAPSALRNLSAHPEVSINLCNPITLRSILALLAEFYDLKPELAGEGVVLR